MVVLILSILLIVGVVASFILVRQAEGDLWLKWCTIAGVLLTLFAFLFLPLLVVDPADKIVQNITDLPGYDVYADLVDLLGLSQIAEAQVIIHTIFAAPELQQVWQVVTTDSFLSGWDILFQMPPINPTFRGWLGWQLVVSALALAGLAATLLTGKPDIDRIGTYVYSSCAGVALLGGLWYLAVIDNLGDKENAFLGLLMALVGGRVGGGTWFILVGNLLLFFNLVLQAGLGWYGADTQFRRPADGPQTTLSRLTPPAIGTSALIILIIVLATVLFRSMPIEPLDKQLSSLINPQSPLLIEPTVINSTAVPITTGEIPAPTVSTAPATSFPTPVPSLAVSAGPTSILPTISAPTVTPLPTVGTVVEPSDLAELQSLALAEINRSRIAEKIQPVAWDQLAAAVAARHAQDMAAHDYFNHRNQFGEGPDHRYNQAGGHDAVAENIYMNTYQYSGDHLPSLADWSTQVITAQLSLMNSPGHRRTILNPVHTQVGVGMAYNPMTGKFYLVQEFISRYIQVEPLILNARVGQSITLNGKFVPGSGATDPTVNLAYESWLSPLTLAQLVQPVPYESSAKFFQTIEPDILADQHFSANLLLNYEGRSGLYHLLIWVRHPNFTEPILATDTIVTIQ